MWLAEYLLMDQSSVASLCGLGMKVHQKSDHNVCRRVSSVVSGRKGTSLKGVSVATIVGNFVVIKQESIESKSDSNDDTCCE